VCTRSVMGGSLLAMRALIALAARRRK